jgi:hypothetical protein
MSAKKKKGATPGDPLVDALIEAEGLELIESAERADGVLVEIYSDRSRRFSGEGRGVLWLQDSGIASLALPPNDGKGFNRIDGLLMLRSHLLGIEKNGIPLVRKGVALESNPENWHILAEFKGDLMALVDALAHGEAQLFRSLADAFNPMPSKRKPSEIEAFASNVMLNAILDSIQKAAEDAGDVPKFLAVLKKFRQTPRNAGESTSQFKRKLTSRGFAWICNVK